MITCPCFLFREPLGKWWPLRIHHGAPRTAANKKPRWRIWFERLRNAHFTIPRGWSREDDFLYSTGLQKETTEVQICIEATNFLDLIFFSGKSDNYRSIKKAKRLFSQAFLELRARARAWTHPRNTQTSFTREKKKRNGYSAVCCACLLSLKTRAISQRIFSEN